MPFQYNIWICFFNPCGIFWILFWVADQNLMKTVSIELLSCGVYFPGPWWKRSERQANVPRKSCWNEILQAQKQKLSRTLQKVPGSSWTWWKLNNKLLKDLLLFIIFIFDLLNLLCVVFWNKNNWFQRNSNSTVCITALDFCAKCELNNKLDRKEMLWITEV